MLGGGRVARRPPGGPRTSRPADERSALLRTLDSQRGHIIDTVEALQGVQVRTATHAGHLDAAVELIDGRQHIVMD